MKMIRYITIAVLTFGLFSCTHRDSKEILQIKIDDRVLYPKTNISVLFDSLRPPTQSFSINGEKDTLIVGLNGTTLTILKNTFVNRNGHTPRTVTINLVEINSISDIINANLQTTSGNDILQTGGMLFIDAKENNESLEIVNGKSIHVELKSRFKAPEMKVFGGNFDSNGKMDWIAPRNLESYLIPIPLNLLDFSKGGLECRMTEKQIQLLTDSKFENTFIATREFEERTRILNLASCGHGDLSQRLIDIYTSNTDRPLFVSDSLAVEYLVKNHSTKIDTVKKFAFNEVGWTTYFYQTFNFFTKEHLTKVIDFDKLGISETTTSEDLSSRGHSQSDADKYITFFEQRKQIVKAIETKNQSSRLASYSFSVNNLGWVNVDRFIDNKDVDVSTFLVQVKSSDSLDFISVSLVIPRLNVAVMSTHNEGNSYSFTKKDDGYRKLPVGQDAIIVAFSYKDNRPYFGRQKIKIPKDGTIDLTLSVTNELTVKSDMAKLTEQ